MTRSSVAAGRRGSRSSGGTPASATASSARRAARSPTRTPPTASRPRFTRWNRRDLPDRRRRTLPHQSIDVRDLGPVRVWQRRIRLRRRQPETSSSSATRPGSTARRCSASPPSSTPRRPARSTNADMEINTLDMEAACGEGPGRAGRLRLRERPSPTRRVTSSGSPTPDVPGATMFARYDQGQTSMRNLSPDDVEGSARCIAPTGDRARSQREDHPGAAVQSNSPRRATTSSARKRRSGLRPREHEPVTTEPHARLARRGEARCSSSASAAGGSSAATDATTRRDSGRRAAGALAPSAALGR